MNPQAILDHLAAAVPVAASVGIIVRIVAAVVAGPFPKFAATLGVVLRVLPDVLGALADVAKALRGTDAAAKAAQRGAALAEVLPLIAGVVLAVTILAAGACGPNSHANTVVPHPLRVDLECAAADAVLQARGASPAEIALAHALCVTAAEKYGAIAAAHSPAPDAGADGR